jgi:hypothetical protein
MMLSVVVLHPLQLPGGHTSPKALPGSTHYSKAEYTNTQQDLPVGDTTSPNLDHERLFGYWVAFAKK